MLLGMARLGGATSFTDVTSTAGVGDTGNARGTAWGDFDGEGDLDLYVANSGDAMSGRGGRSGSGSKALVKGSVEEAHI